jgi:hypothetical protein
VTKYKISVSFDEKNFFWIVVDKEKFIRNPTKEDLMGAKLRYYNKTNICRICREEGNITDKSILYPKNVLLETSKEGNKTNEYVCHRHGKRSYDRYNHNSRNNIIKSLADSRTKNQNPNSTHAKGENSIELACKLYGWEDLNKKNDNYSTGTPIDCYDPKTGLYYQVKGHRYSQKYKWWHFTNFGRERKKIYKGMVCLCISEDEKIIERIYMFPLIEIKRVETITIYKYDSIGRLRKDGWYEKYRVKDEDELKKANEIWAQILEKRKKVGRRQ